MPDLESFDTREIAPSRRLEYWNELACNTFTPIVADAADIRNFSPSLMRSRIGELRIGTVCSSPSIVHHGPEHVARTRDALYFLQLQLTGSSLNCQDQREAALGPGDFTVFDATRPYQMRFAAANSVLVIGIPEVLMKRHVLNPEGIVARAMRYDDGVNQMLADFAFGLWRHCCAGSQVAAPTLVSALLHLVGGAYAAEHACPWDAAPRTDALRMRIVQLIENNLHDGELSPVTIAARLKTSLRYVHAVFSRGEETISRYIRRRRLEECARLLCAAPHASRTVSDIAFDFGFASATHFGKAFREHFGVTPTQYRRRQSGSSGAARPAN